MLASSYATQGVMIYGIDQEQEKAVSRIREAQVKGSPITKGRIAPRRQFSREA